MVSESLFEAEMIITKTLVSVVPLLLFFSVDPSIAHWTRVQSPEIRIPLWTYAVATKGETILVGTYRGTIYRSTNNGLSWAQSDAGISFLYWTHDFFLTGETVFAIGEEGVFRSTNVGESWAVKNDGLKGGMVGPNVYSMVQSGDLLFAATDFGVYRSSNDGDYWYPSTGDSSYWSVYSLAVLNGQLFAGTDDAGIFRSTDNGNTWNAVNNGLPRNAFGHLGLTNSLFVDAANIYAGNDILGVYRSSDNGNMWAPETTGLPHVYGGQFFPISSLTKIGSYIFAGTQDDGIYQLTGIGGSWFQVATGLPAESYVTSISSNGNQVFAASSTGVYYSDLDNISWSPLFTEAPGKVNIDLVRTSGSNILVSASSQYWNGMISGVYRSPNIGYSWFRDPVLSTEYITSLEAYGDSVYATGNDINFSSNNGDTWIRIDSSLPYPNTLIKENSTLYVGCGHGNWQWGEAGGLFFSTNNGTSWNEIWKADTAVFALAIIGNNLFAGGLHGVFRSTNNCLDWSAVNNGLPANVWVDQLSTIASNLFASTGKDIYMSSNNGDSWFEAHNGLPNDSTGPSSPTQLLVNNNQLFAGTSSGVYVSTDIGANWTAANTGLNGDALNIQSLAIHGTELFVATKDGLWQRTISDLLSDEYINTVFRIYQNYPNPFNPTTKIKYTLLVKSKVTLTIYNLLGQELAVLVDEVQDTGDKEVSFIASKLSSGIYFYRMTAGAFSETKKLLLVK
jgi:photosystem II stability/assembly factor-like uncharacterized protein